MSKNILIVFIAIWVAGCSISGMQFYYPDQTQIRSDEHKSDRYLATVELVNITPRHSELNSAGFSVFYRHIIPYWDATNIFIQALSREIERRGGKVKKGANKKIRIGLWSLFSLGGFTIANVKGYAYMYVTPQYKVDLSCWTTTKRKDGGMNVCLSEMMGKVLADPAFRKVMMSR